jgi:ubiquinone/menaquinone biosynthesis C-methylase UbiE
MAGVACRRATVECFMTDARDMAVSAVFDRAAEVYDTAIPFARFGRRLVELADVQTGESVLDLA